MYVVDRVHVVLKTKHWFDFYNKLKISEAVHFSFNWVHVLVSTHMVIGLWTKLHTDVEADSSLDIQFQWHANKYNLPTLFTA